MHGEEADSLYNAEALLLPWWVHSSTPSLCVPEALLFRKVAGYIRDRGGGQVGTVGQRIGPQSKWAHSHIFRQI